MVTEEYMHARSHAATTALCGATGNFAWSLDADAVTCPKCRAALLMLGEPLRPKRAEPLITPICLPTVEGCAPPAAPKSGDDTEASPAPAGGGRKAPGRPARPKTRS